MVMPLSPHPNGGWCPVEQLTQFHVVRLAGLVFHVRNETRNRVIFVGCPWAFITLDADSVDSGSTTAQFGWKKGDFIVTKKNYIETIDRVAEPRYATCEVFEIRAERPQVHARQFLAANFPSVVQGFALPDPVQHDQQFASVAASLYETGQGKRSRFRKARSASSSGDFTGFRRCSRAHARRMLAYPNDGRTCTWRIGPQHQSLVAHLRPPASSSVNNAAIQTQRQGSSFVSARSIRSGVAPRDASSQHGGRAEARTETCQAPRTEAPGRSHSDSPR